MPTAMPGLWLLLSLIFACIAESDNVRETSVTSKGLKLKNIYKRSTVCREGQHLADSSLLCCQLCPAGRWKSRDCEVSEGAPVCELCEEGKEYTENDNYLNRCFKCKYCDEVHGLEVAKNCTRTQNTQCRCKANFFCINSLCDQCEPCSTCEHGIIEKCTPTSNAKCKEKDIDLSEYITYIAYRMTMNEVKEFVRKNGTEEAKIDEIKSNYPQDAAEQKVQMLRTWYQQHGKKGAYRTLITGLKKANLCAHAEKLQELVQKGLPSDAKTASITNENERQSSAET
ncbi:PREDICTED: tumor necrosis factor receptor superfamily member 6 [Elephantulus edwardii]|uniref:tumor necrosis factor receptor superfamily member 6 n=1 Tax=Elephantulus edwardii TaxID=28737 RepID=UPI0003F082DC|nr:PREDICTED: tumor necrosis factor receptor superfamily member 6 [Elephantulus edwardii]